MTDDVTVMFDTPNGRMVASGRGDMAEYYARGPFSLYHRLVTVHDAGDVQFFAGRAVTSDNAEVGTFKGSCGSRATANA
jgi:hypothetical protein